ncbi:hypothetical protein [Tuwongella immobilis]|uniref:Uncharacterized protein n=1 Tax=Tuwongella immobilis TaxID=692036 RepID=A0A6C2YNK7_9BACT|nr:hypothetical protein [Tuwongella immobilis]VIP03016.1 unnamed protein product [Tuwongella immobilis]VTS03135.1 unnamed protein product [Tuwongella immobilis]
MSGWIREIVGWLLVAVGLVIFGLCYLQFLRNRQIFEAGPMAFMGFIIFRGGIHLLKVAIAARICRESLTAPTTKSRAGNPPLAKVEPRRSNRPKANQSNQPKPSATNHQPPA